MAEPITVHLPEWGETHQFPADASGEEINQFLSSLHPGPPPPKPPLPGGLGGPPLAGLGVPAPVSIPMYNQAGQIREAGGPLSGWESLAMAPLRYFSGGAQQLGQGLTQMHEAQTGSQFAGGLSDAILGGGRLATLPALPEAFPAIAAAPWSSGIRAAAGLGTGLGMEELNQRLVPAEYQGYGDLASTLAGIKAAEVSPETLLRAGKAGLSGLGAYGREIHLFKPFTPLTGLGSAWDAARGSWEASGPQPRPRGPIIPPPPVTYPKTPEATGAPKQRIVAPPPVTYQPAPQAKPVVPPPPVTYQQQPIPAAGRVVPPPPVTYQQQPTPQAKPVVAPPPVTYREMPEATGAPKQTKIGPLQFQNRFWNPETGETMTVDKMDRTALNATLHSEAQDLDIAPVGGLRGAGPKVKVPSGFMDIVAKDKFGKPYRELSDDQLRQMINDRTLHNYKVK